MVYPRTPERYRRRVASEETAVDQLLHLARGEIEDADPRAVDRGAERSKQHAPSPGKRLGPPMPQLARHWVRD